MPTVPVSLRVIVTVVRPGRTDVNPDGLENPTSACTKSRNNVGKSVRLELALHECRRKHSHTCRYSFAFTLAKGLVAK